MPIYIRDSISLGPFRVNLSKSGLGFSAGVKGFRIGAGPKGHYIHVGMKGVYYRKTLGSLGRKPKTIQVEESAGILSEIEKIAPGEQLPTYLTEDGVLMRRIISAQADLLVPESHSEALKSLNEARERPSVTMLLSFFSMIGIVFAFLVESPVAVAGFVIALGSGLMLGQMIDLPRRNVIFAYNLDPDAEKRYNLLVEAIDRIGECNKVWFVKARGDITTLHAWKKNSGATGLLDTTETSVGYALPRGVASNLTPPMIVIDGKKCYFFPDCILIQESNRFGAVRYENLRTAIRDQRMIMDVAPSDSRIVGQTWKYVNKNGSPDRRFNNNRQLPICLFEEIGMIGDGGFKGMLQVSKYGASGTFGSAMTEVGRCSKELKDAKPLLIDQE